MSELCSQLTNEEISNGNNFDTTWEDFCATGAGACIDDCQANCETDVYPGDLNHDGIVDNQDVALSGLYLNNYGIAREQEHQNIDWYPHPSQDWGFENNQNVDLKHHDCNGDGLLDETDTLAISNNYGLTWKTPEPPPPPPEQSDYQVLLQPIDQIYDGYLVMNVSLERQQGGNLSLLSGHFTIDYSDVEGNFSYVDLDFFPITWLGVPNNNLWFNSTHFTEEQKIEVGFTKTNNADSEGSGVIGQLILEYDKCTLIRQFKYFLRI